jgi:hypothetical protein
VTRELRTAFVLCLAIVGAAHAESRPESWNRRIQDTVAALQAGETETAHATIDGVLREMSRKADPGKAAQKGIGRALMLRALAEAQRGDERLATWDWHLAQQFDPALESWNLSEFGAAGAMLARHRISIDPPPSTEPGEELIRRGATPVKVLKRGSIPDVERPRERRWQGKLNVSAVVLADGRPTHPRLETETHEAGLMYQVCESLRTSEFEPARLDGQPIPAPYSWGFGLVLE